jgi:hypothetical protein
MRKKKFAWTPIEEFDETGEPRAVHIMPVVMTESFATEKEAWDFLKTVEDAGFPCLADEDGNVVCTYFGHVVRPDCSCQPDLKRDSLTPAYFHRAIQ